MSIVIRRIKTFERTCKGCFFNKNKEYPCREYFNRTPPCGNGIYIQVNLNAKILKRVN
jgi:hypothetical protein